MLLRDVFKVVIVVKWLCNPWLVFYDPLGK